MFDNKFVLFFVALVIFVLVFSMYEDYQNSNTADEMAKSPVEVDYPSTTDTPLDE